MKNKTILIGFIAVMFLVTAVSAIENPFNQGWQEQIGRESRGCVYDVKPWGYVVNGVMGRMSDGTYKCFVPGNKKVVTATAAVTTPISPSEPECPEPEEPEPEPCVPGFDYPAYAACKTGCATVSPYSTCVWWCKFNANIVCD